VDLGLLDEDMAGKRERRRRRGRRQENGERNCLGLGLKFVMAQMIAMADSNWKF